MASSTYKSFLMIKESDTYKKLVDIKDYPDLGGEPEMLETTTLSDSMQTYVPGIQSIDALTFSINYSKEDLTALKALEGVEHDFAVWFGGTESAGVITPTGDEGKFKFSGKLSAFVSGGGVNEVRGITATIAPSTPITIDED